MALKNKFWLLPVCVLAPLTLLTSCQTTQPLTTAEALVVAGEFKGTGFVAPPKSVEDVLAQLNAASGQNQQRLKDARTALSEPQPQGGSAQDRAKWLFKRARAAHVVGDIVTELASYRQARAEMETSKIRSGTFLFLVHFELARAEMLGGDFSAALDRMREAPKFITDSVDDETSQSFAPIPLIGYAALAYADVGDLPAATTAMKDVERRYRAESRWFPEWPYEGVRMVRASRDAARGAVAKVSGDLSQAETHFRTAIDDFSIYKGFTVSRYINYDRAILDVFYQTLQLELAEVLRRQGRLAEAEAMARQALTGALESHGRYSAHTANVLRRLTGIVLEQGRLGDARKLAQVSLETLDASGVGETGIARALARITHGAALGADGKWVKALMEYDAAERALKNDPVAFDGFLSANPDWGMAKLFGGSISDAQAIFRRAVQRSESLVGSEVYETQELAGLVAVADARQGREDRARTQLKGIVPTLLQGSSGSDQGNRYVRDWRRRLILETYLDIITRLGTNDAEAIAESFRVGSVLGRGLVERTIALSGARAGAGEAASLLREEQDASLRLAALNDQISAALVSGGDATTLRTQADQLRRARVALRLEIETQHPDLAELINPKPMGLASAQALLRPGEALIVTYFGRERGYVWALRADAPAQLHRTSFSEDDIRDMVDELRVALDPSPQILADIPPFDVALAHRLYKELLLPVRDVWGDAQDLIVAAHGPLGFLPISVLPMEDTPASRDGSVLFSGYRDVAWLAKSHGVAIIPSVGTLRTLRGVNGAEQAGNGFIGFGDPIFNPQEKAAAVIAKAAVRGATDMRAAPIKLRALPSIRFRQSASADLTVLPRLPDTADELHAIARALKANPATSLHLREAAGEDIAKGLDYSGIGTVAFATHGLISGDLDGLTQPALALSHPALRGGQGDGLLSADEILGLNLSADWIVLSACNTGSGDGRGAEAVSGLGRSFFYAGARALLVSNWPVHSQSATALTTGLFHSYRDSQTSKAQALRLAMTGLIDGPGYTDDQGRSLFAYAHPIFWGPFSVIGSPSR